MKERIELWQKWLTNLLDFEEEEYFNIRRRSKVFQRSCKRKYFDEKIKPAEEVHYNLGDTVVMDIDLFDYFEKLLNRHIFNITRNTQTILIYGSKELSLWTFGEDLKGIQYLKKINRYRLISSEWYRWV